MADKKVNLARVPVQYWAPRPTLKSVENGTFVRSSGLGTVSYVDGSPQGPVDKIPSNYVLIPRETAEKVLPKDLHL